jgi:probable phosphoglycerate mutase
VSRNATTVLLVRHGETDWNREGRMQGWAPTGLNDRGHEQARRLGASLAAEYDIDRVVASDLCRTRETTAGIRDGGVEAEPTFDSGWRERSLGVYQGFTRAELNEQFPAFALYNGALALEEQPEGGESFVEMYERVTDAWQRLLADAGDETVLVVTHGGPITMVLAMFERRDLLSAVKTYGVKNCGLSEIEVGEEIRRQDDLLFEPVRDD